MIYMLDDIDHIHEIEAAPGKLWMRINALEILTPFIRLGGRGTSDRLGSTPTRIQSRRPASLINRPISRPYLRSDFAAGCLLHTTSRSANASEASVYPIPCS